MASSATMAPSDGTYSCIGCDKVFSHQTGVRAHWQVTCDTSHRGTWRSEFAEFRRRAPPPATVAPAKQSQTYHQIYQSASSYYSSTVTYGHPDGMVPSYLPPGLDATPLWTYEFLPEELDPDGVWGPGLPLPVEQFRSSRTTRNFDPNAQRGRGGIIDHDVTDGLPVQPYRVEQTIVKQDITSNDNDESTQPDDPNAAFPWPEPALPSFFHQLQPHSQELLRRARAGDRRTEISVYDKKTETYYLPSQRQPKKTTATNGLESPAANHEAEEDENDDEDPDALAAETGDGESQPKKSSNEPRTFMTSKWNAVPAVESDKMTEKKYLADRRPGMPSLYGQFGGTAIGFTGENLGTAGGVAGIDLGDGAGLGDAGALLGGAGTATPTRKGPPPKRKKKKLGGPGRKKANLGVTAETAFVGGEAGPNVSGEGAGAEVAAGAEKGEGEGEGEQKEESGSETEEGSEDGEIQEEKGEGEEPKPATPAVVEVDEVNEEDEEGEEKKAEEVDLLSSLDAAVDKDMADQEVPK